MSERVYGIDLGTTYCAATALQVGSFDAQVLNIGGGYNNPTLASQAFFEPVTSGWRANVGQHAQQKEIEAGDEGVFVEVAKRHIGANPPKTWNYDGENFDPIDVSALILRKIAKQIERETGDRDFRAVVTHPREFSVPQRDATQEAIEYAGIDLIDTLFEPVAAAYAYFEPGVKREAGPYLVFDLGGGTLDIALLDVPETGNIKVSGGTGADIGGHDWDNRMLDEILGSLKRHNFPDSDDLRFELSQQTLRELREKAIDWKEKSGMREEFNVEMQEIRFNDGEKITAKLGGFRVEDWEERCDDLLRTCRDNLDDVLAEAGLRDDDLVKVLPVGGSSKLEMIQDMLEERFGNRVVSLHSRTYNPQLAVAQGAGRFASFQATAEEADRADTAVPDEQKALVEEAQMVTDFPHEICLEARTSSGDKRFSALIKKGTELPAKVQKSYTVPRGMDRIVARLYECEEGPYQSGIPEAARIEFPKSLNPEPGDRVTFILDVKQSAQVEVTARHEGTGKTQKIELQTDPGAQAPVSGQSDEQSRKRFLQEIEIQ